MVDPQEESKKLRHEAAQRLNRMFGISPGYSNNEVDRIVECIVFAAVLEVAALQARAASGEGG